MWNSLLVAVLRRFFKVGLIELTLANGETHLLGDRQAAPFKVQFHDPGLARGFLTHAEMALGEGYTNGTITLQDDDLDGFLRIIVQNRVQSDGHLFERLRKARFALTRLTSRNPVGRARSNVAHHYDLSAELYDLFLDTDRQYSCAYFEAPDQPLEDAQGAKKALIARKLYLKPGMRVLDIGCGWGGTAITLARDYGVDVVGVTLSQEQHKIAVDRVAAAGLSDRVDIRLQDYRHVTERFDRVVSIGMFEHVGTAHYGEYFKKIDALLTDTGIALVHTIGTSSAPQMTSAWITKYIFPGGHIPALTEISPHIEGAGLTLSDLEVWRLHYALTLRAWYDRFMANVPAVEALYDERFVRMWRFYLLASENTFRHGRQVVFQMQITKRNDTLPLQRNYMYDLAEVN